jgi:lipoprotein-anchoring transpeptidase ErfK/SrfK
MRLFSRVTPLVVLWLLLAGFSGCQISDPRYRPDVIYLGGYSEREDARGNFDNYSHWDGEGKAGAPSIVIRLSEQRAYFFKGGELAGVSTISTGREGFGTPSGTFKIQQKDRNHASGTYGDYVDAAGRIIKKDIDRFKDPMPPGTRFDGAKMPFFMRIHGGVGMHEGFLPGYPASHGCIRMPRFMAEAFFNNVQVGTPVAIEP